MTDPNPTASPLPVYGAPILTAAQQHPRVFTGLNAGVNAHLDKLRLPVTEIANMSPTSIKFIKHSLRADTDRRGGLSNTAEAVLEPFIETPEGREGALAFTEKHQPDLAQFA